MKQMFDCPELFSEKQWILEKPVDTEKLRIETERGIRRLALKRRRETESLEYVTFPSQLAGREWRDAEGGLPIVRPPAHFDETEDRCTGLLYRTESIREDDLPPVYIKKEKKRETLIGSGGLGLAGSSNSGQPLTNASASSPALGTAPLSPTDKPKIKREESVTTAPKSIFDRPKPFKTIQRPRPTGGVINPVSFGGSQSLSNQLASSLKTVIRDREADSGPEWSIQEDWALHQAILSLQEMPLSLNANSPAHISNWDMVSDIVNAVSRCFRSPRQCRNRYEMTILPREEGKILYNDLTPTKKPKKTKLNLKQPSLPEKKPLISKPMKTSVLFKQDNNNACSAQFAARFETIKAIANKRTPTTQPVLVNSTNRNPRHASVLADFSVNYDTPLSPVQVAANRAERILREKQRSQQAAAAQAQLAAQQPVITAASAPQSIQQQQQLVQQQTVRVSLANVAAVAASNPTAAVVASAGSQGSPAQAVVVGISQPVQQQQQQGLVVSGASHVAAGAVNASRVGSVAGTASQAVVTVSGVLTGLQTTSTLTRLAGGQIIVSQAGKTTAAGLTSRSLTQAQLMVLKKKEQMRARQVLQNNSLVVSSGVVASAVSTAAVTTTARMMGTSAAAAVATQGVGRGQIVRPTNVRSMTEPELKAMLQKQQLKVTGPSMVHVQPGTSLSTAQLQQLGIQVATPPGSASAQLVKAVASGAGAGMAVAGASTSTGTGAANATGAGPAGKSVTIPLAGVNLQGGQLKTVAGRGTVVTGPQNLQLMRQLMMRKGGVQQKVALQQVAGKPTQLIVQGQQGKALPATVTVQQLQEIVKSVAGSGQGQVQIGTVAGTGQQILSHAVFTKTSGAGGQTVQARVIPVSGAAAAAAGRSGQQTIQVVAAGPAAVQRRAVPNVTVDAALGRQQGGGGAASALASALAAGNHVKMSCRATQQQILSALAGQTGQQQQQQQQQTVTAVGRSAASSSTVSYQAASAGGVVPQTVKTVINQQPPQQQQIINSGQQTQVINSSAQQQLVTNQQPQQHIISSQQLGALQHQLASSQPLQTTSQPPAAQQQQQQQIVTTNQQLVNLQLNATAASSGTGQPNQSTESAG